MAAEAMSASRRNSLLQAFEQGNGPIVPVDGVQPVTDDDQGPSEPMAEHADFFRRVSGGECAEFPVNWLCNRIR